MECTMLAADEFWSRVAKADGDACWEWTATRGRTGYGVIPLVVDGRKTSMGAHRRAWELTNGDIPGGQHVLHRCDNPPCVRPDHLYLGTHAENMADMVKKGRNNYPGRGKGKRRRRGEVLSLKANPEIRSVEDVVRDHIHGVIAAHPDVPQYVLAVSLGWSPSTLCRRLADWARDSASAETLIGDRR